jgi:propanediol dehydratase small subunit
MTVPKLTTADYPLAERRPDLVRGKRGKGLDAMTLDAVVAGEVTLDDLSITARALKQQAEIARDAGRSTLAQNFERAADLVEVPQDTIMRIYELLRPGRAVSKEQLILAADELEKTYAAATMAAFIREAAEVYERRGLFRRRY